MKAVHQMPNKLATLVNVSLTNVDDTLDKKEIQSALSIQGKR